MGNAIETCGNCDGSGRVLAEEQWLTCADCGGNGVLVGGETRQERHERSQKEAAEALRDAGKRTRAAAKPKATADAP